MTASPIFGRYTPGDSVLHRSPAWAKIAGIAAVSAGVLVVDRAWVSAAVLIAVVLVGRRAGLPWRTVLAPLKILSIILAVSSRTRASSSVCCRP